MRRSTPLLLMLLGVAALNFAWMPGEFLAGDPFAWREETRSMLSGSLSVPAEVVTASGERGQHFVEHPGNGRYYAKYGIANSLMAMPPMLLERALGGDITKRLAMPGLLPYNLWNLALGLALAALLYVLSGTYSKRAGVRVLYVVAAFYCTSLWFYLRAQSSEICQTLFFTALYVSLLGFLRPLRERGARGLDARAWRWLAAAWACVALLVFTRIVYGLLMPLTVLLAAWCAAQGRSWSELRRDAPRLAAALLLPPLAILAVLAIVNHVKFGAPWLTGYHQWRAATHFPVGRLADGLWGYLFSARFSIFLTFPLLIFALVALRRFIERHRLDAVVMLSIFGAFLLFLAKLPSWAGEWSYGPRYLLPMLPVLSLPFLLFADDVLDRIGTWRARAWAAAAVAALAYSAYLQVQVTRMPFWTYYNARILVDALVVSPETLDYFFNHHDAVVVNDVIRHRSNLAALPYLAEVEERAPPQLLELYRDNLGRMLERGNLYWALPSAERR